MKEFRVPGAVVTTRLGLQYRCKHGHHYYVIGSHVVPALSSPRARQLAVALSLPDGREFVKEGPHWRRV
jgi:hypothetical protein